MPKRSKVETLLPETVKAELTEKLVSNGFSDYLGLTTWLNAQGFEISRAAVHRFGQDLQAQYKEVGEQLRQSRELAELMMAQIGNTPNSQQSQVLIEILRNMILKVLVKFQADELPDSKVIRDLSLSIKTLADSSKVTEALIATAKQEARMEAQQQVSAAAKSLGISPEVEQSIRDILIGKAA